MAVVVVKRETERWQGVYSSVGEYFDGSRRRTNRVVSRLGITRCSKSLTVPRTLSQTDIWKKLSSLSRCSDTRDSLVKDWKVCGTEFKKARYSKLGAASRHSSNASRSNTLSARVSDLMVGERWVERGKADLNVNRSRNSDSPKKDSREGSGPWRLSSRHPYSFIRMEKCSRTGMRKSRAASKQ